MKKVQFLFIALLITTLSFAQELNTKSESETPPPCPCCTDAHKQFLFWVGEWNVFDQKGEKVGENSITKLQDGCIISENWRGTSGLNGSSYNYYKVADSTWHQVWVDNKGNALNLKGKYNDGKMILKSELLKGNKINWYYNQITWIKNADGTVTQRWETYDKEHRKQSLLFLGTYKRK